MFKSYLIKLAEENGRGVISDHILIKANETYIITSNDIINREEYDIIVSKSFFNSYHGIEDNDISKAVLPGTIKIVDGITYIYTATPNAKTPYDWRVYSPSAGSALNTSKQTSKKAFTSQDFINEMFPKSLSSFKFINKVGGSTGAALMEDDKGNQYISKLGKNTSNAHLESEYLANQLYEILGVRTPDYELYDVNGDKTLMSKFIPNAKTLNASDYPELAKNFMVDTLLANWDVYQNDNCLKDASGRIYRVDNGGSLLFSATGRYKNFDDKVDLDSMIKHNGHIFSNLTQADVIQQIDDLSKKKQVVLDFLEATGNLGLKDKMESRFDSLDKVKSDYESKQNAIQARKNKKRKLLPEAQMYRVFDDVELDSLWNSVSGGWRSRLSDNDGATGWNLLSNICEERGFNARPEVVSEFDYWNLVQKNPTNQVFRGVESSKRKSADELVDDFSYEDECFYGTVGIYGAGIYFHMNDSTKGAQFTKADYKQSGAYHHAKNYGQGVIEGVLSPKAKIISNKDLMRELESQLVYDAKKAKPIIDNINALNAEIKDDEDNLNNISSNTVNSIRGNMHWDDTTYVMMPVEIEDIDWGNKDDNGNPDYPSFDSFFSKVDNWVKSNGGTVTEKQVNSGEFVLTLPNSKEKFLFSKYSYELPSSIKQKNAFTKAYSYPVERFQNWIMSQHYNKIDKEVEKGINDLGSQITIIKHDINSKRVELTKAEDDLAALKNKKVASPDSDIISACIHAHQNGNSHALGVYGALKGYDAIKVHNGNGMGNSFLVVLNRSKLITKG